MRHRREVFTRCAVRLSLVLTLFATACGVPNDVYGFYCEGVSIGIAALKSLESMPVPTPFPVDSPSDDPASFLPHPDDAGLSTTVSPRPSVTPNPRDEVIEQLEYALGQLGVSGRAPDYSLTGARLEAVDPVYEMLSAIFDGVTAYSRYSEGYDADGLGKFYPTPPPDKITNYREGIATPVTKQQIAEFEELSRTVVDCSKVELPEPAVYLD